jgi:hypothetical protein
MGITFGARNPMHHAYAAFSLFVAGGVGFRRFPDPPPLAVDKGRKENEEILLVGALSLALVGSADAVTNKCISTNATVINKCTSKQQPQGIQVAECWCEEFRPICAGSIVNGVCQ